MPQTLYTYGFEKSELPVYITISYGKNFMKLPVNPEVLEKTIPSTSETVEIEGIGEVSIPSTPKLATISIDSFFWQQIDYTLPALYVAWIERWQKSKKPATLIVTRFNYSMLVTCENFVHSIKAGEDKDVYYKLDLKEYRPYGAKKVNSVKNEKLLTKLKNYKDIGMDYVPVVVAIPRKTRDSSSKEIIENPYTVMANETITSITKKITGTTDDWKKLYDQNSTILGNVFNDSSVIPSGTKLTLPDSWVNESDKTIISI